MQNSVIILYLKIPWCIVLQVHRFPLHVSRPCWQQMGHYFPFLSRMRYRGKGLIYFHSNLYLFMVNDAGETFGEVFSFSGGREEVNDFKYIINSSLCSWNIRWHLYICCYRQVVVWRSSYLPTYIWLLFTILVLLGY